MKAKSKPLVQKTPEELGVDITPRLATVQVREPSKREAGVKLASVDELIDRLKTLGVVG
jgi:electron transfer flavoprotein beta subunit